MPETYSNRYQTTLTEGLDASEVGVDVASVTGAPSGRFRIVVDDEIMLVTSISSLTLNVERGVEGSTAATHSSGAVVKGVLSAASLNLAGPDLGWYGDGSDGDATLDGATNYNTWSSRSSSVYTLTRDVVLANLTINSGVTLQTASFRIFVRGLLYNRGTILGNPNDGASPAAGGQTPSTNSTGYGFAGGAGTNQLDANGAAGTATNTQTGAGAAGGAGGGAGVRTGGAGGASAGGLATGGQVRYGTLRQAWVVSTGRAMTGPGLATDWLLGGAGGGGGANNNTTASNRGGGGGSGGIIVIIVARAIDNDGGVISARGGHGGNANINGGGGGGGGGGALLMMYDEILEGAGTISAPGGTGGNAAGVGTAGSNGSAGLVIKLANR
jgi:hypothetical protein